jgi:serine protease
MRWLVQSTLSSAGALALAIGGVVLISAVSPARATPRGKRPPRRLEDSSASPFAPDAARVAPPSTLDFVQRPPACVQGSLPLRYHGGALVQHPDVFVLFWGSEWNTDPEQQAAKVALISMFQNIGTSDFACAWREYAVPAYPLGAGSYDGSYVITTNPPGTVDDATIRQKIQDEITAGHAPARTDDRIYFVAPKKGVVVMASDGSTGCGGANFVFCGYHDSFGITGAAFRYSVLPYPCSSGNGTCFADPTNDPGISLQTTGSHELTETVTDPDSPPIDNGGWFTAGPGNENADICAACPDTLTVGAQTYNVNPAWSNLARGCVTGVACAAPPIECTDGSPGLCVPGTGAANTCEFEWLVDPNLTRVARTQLPGRIVACADGQLFCDADGAADGQCTFRVAACLNSGDPRLACAPTAVTGLKLASPLLASVDPVNVANAGTLLGALATVDPHSAGMTTGHQIIYSPAAATPDACTNYLPVVVPALRTRTLVVFVQTSFGLARNSLTLRCGASLQ